MKEEHRVVLRDLKKGPESLLRSLMDFTEGGASVGHLHNTGAWSEKALKEAARVSDSKAIWSGKEENFRQLPTSDHYTPRPEARYLHYTSNNTIYGTQFASPPQAEGVPLIADMSSDICSRPVNLDQHAIIYAGAQKNLGPSGLTVVILSPWALEQSRANGASREGGIPSMLNYALMADKDSLFNTPNTLAIFALERVLAWLEDLGGLRAVEELNEAKAQLLYKEIDRSEFWTPHAHRDNRSRMNITWRAPTEALEADFLAEAHQQGLHSLKGHRSIGGIRASTYNACPLAGVEALVEFMGHFEATHG